MSAEPKTLEEIMASPNAVPAPSESEAPKTDELEILFPTPATFEVNGESVTIREFKFGELSSLMRLLKVVGPISSARDPLAALSIFENSSDELFKLLSLNVRKPMEWLVDLDADIGMAMLKNMIAVNVSFFMNRVVPRLAK